MAFPIDNPSARVVLVAHDTGPRIKAVQRGIEVVELPARYQLPSAIEGSEKELAQLRRRVIQLENQFPKLDLGFEGGSRYRNVSIPGPYELGESEILQRMDQLKEQYPLRAASRKISE